MGPRVFIFVTLLLSGVWGQSQPVVFDGWPKGASPQEIGERIADRFLASPHASFSANRPPAFIIYPETCTWYGALTFAKLDGDTNLTARLIRRFEPLFGAEQHLVPRPVNVDSTVFGVVPLELYRQTKDPRYLEMGRMFADKQWERPDDVRKLKPEEIAAMANGFTWQTRYWIDDMYMITMVQVQAYRATGDARYLDRAAWEMVAYLDRLQQPNGLFYHAPDVPFFWGRGNGWVAAGMSELLRLLPEDHPARARILAGYRKMMAALLRYQTAGGAWRQLIDQPDAWPESSCTGMFTFALITGVKNGWLDAAIYGPAARRGWLALVKFINADGDVTAVCEGTNKKNDRQYYLDRKRKVGDMHGQAPVLWCASALLCPASAKENSGSESVGDVRESSGASSSNFFNVRRFGALGDGTNLDSPAINRAIAAAAAAGGGTVFLPAGTYLCGSIHLTNNLNLCLDAGATILGAPQDWKAYDPAEPFTGRAYQDGGHTFFHNSLIWGEGLTNVTLSGHGMINGGGLVRSADILDHISGFSSRLTNAPAPDDLRIGDKAVCLKLCRNVLIRDVTIFHGGWFAILVTGCDNLTIDNVTIDTDRDGMDLDCCRNTMVSNCRVNSPCDDGICPKSTCALGEPRITENLTIVNCQVSGFEEGTLIDGTMKPARGGIGRIKFGTESSGGFRNCTVANCTFRSCHGLALEEVDGGILENITINNLTMTDVRDYAIYLTTGKRNRTPNLTTNSRMRNILISNVIVDGVDKMSGIQIMGLPEQPIEGVRLENIRLTSNGGGTRADAAINPRELGTGYPEPGKIGTVPAYGIFARHVRDLELANIHLDFRTNDFRPAAAFADIQGLELDNFNPEVCADVKAAVFADSVQAVTIRDSPALEGVTK